MLESHYCEVKALPPGFEVLVTGPECRIEAMGHTHRPIYGTAFCPECFDDDHPDGRQILRSFFRIAGLLTTRM